MYAQLQQKEQAKAEALEKYYMDYEKSINPKGLGEKELDIFNKKYNAAREYWMKNKEEITHPTKYGAGAQSTYFAALKDADGYLDVAKQATAERKAFVDFIKQQKAQGKHISDNYLDIMNKAMLPPEGGYVAPDYSQIKIYNAHDPIKFSQKLDTILKRNEGMPTKQFLPGSKTEYQWVTPKYVNKDEARVVAYGELKGPDSDGYIEYLSNVAKDPVFVNGLSKVYQENTGKKLDVNDLGELSYANILSQVPVIMDRPTGVELTESEKTRLALQRQKPTATAPAAPQGNLFDTLPNIPLGSGGKIENGVAVDKNGNPLTGNVYIEKINIPTEILDGIGVGASDKKVTGFNVVFENGVPQQFVNKLTGTLTRQAMYNKQLKMNTEPGKGPQPTYAPANKKETLAEKMRRLRNSKK
mgnify:CR=1 FL=1